MHRVVYLPKNKELSRRIEEAKKWRDSQLLTDPIERADKETAEIIKEAFEKANTMVDPSIITGRCHAIWGYVKKILEEEHGITWFSPSEMNPGVMLD